MNGRRNSSINGGIQRAMRKLLVTISLISTAACLPATAGQDREPVPQHMQDGNKLELADHNCVVEAPEGWTWYRSGSLEQDPAGGSREERYHAVSPDGAGEFLFWVTEDETGRPVNAAFVDQLKQQLASVVGESTGRLEGLRYSPVDTPFAGSYRFTFATGDVAYVGYVGGTFRKKIFLAQSSTGEDPPLFRSFVDSFELYNRKPY